MTKQAIVVGLGQFGLALARSLSQKGVEVLAVDQREEQVRAAAAFATEAVAFDATDEAALARAVPERRDVCVCAIGDESREGSIIVTAMLRQMGAKRLIARATDPLHERILRLVGAHEVINPERLFGERYATRLLYASVIDEIQLGEDLVITELQPPAPFVGKTLIDLALPRKHELNVVAVRRGGTSSADMPIPNRAIESDDLLVVVSRPGAVARLLEGLS
jgi:trk system potassium uptake protein TrkA